MSKAKGIFIYTLEKQRQQNQPCVNQSTLCLRDSLLFPVCIYKANQIDPKSMHNKF